MVSFIHSNNLVGIITSKLRNIKVIVCEHTNHTIVSSYKVKFTREYLYRFANATTVLTSFDVEYYDKHGANVVIMPNPIDTPVYISEFASRDKTILAIGDLNRYKGKGFDNLLDIINPILKNNSDWKLKIAGSGDIGLQILTKKVEELGLKEQVIFTGFCNKIYELMQNAQIFVLPSKYEGLPMGLMEALSNGMACIAYNCPSGPSDLIENYKNGILIKNQDHKAMQQGLHQLIEDGKLSEKLAKNAPVSMTPYTLDKIISKWEFLFDSLILKNVNG